MDAEILKASAGAVGRILAVSCVGVYCGKYPKEAPLMSQEVRKGIGKLLLQILVPALATHSVATSVTAEGLKEMWPLFVWCFMSVLLGSSCSYLVSKMLSLEGAYQKAFIAAGTFGNNVGLPLLILATLCKEPLLLDKYPDCKRQSFGLIMLYGIPWRVAMFGIAIPLLKKTTCETITPDDVGDIEMLAQSNEEEDYQEDQSPADEAGEGVETSTTTTLSMFYRLREKISKLKFRIDINIAGPLLGIVIGSIPGVQDFLVGNGTSAPTLPVFGDLLETLGEPVVALSTMVLAAALVPKEGSVKEFCKPEVIKQVIGLCTVRFAIVPVTGYALVYLSKSFMPGSGLQWLVILIEFSVPSAQIVIVSMAAMGKHVLASSMAPVYAVQYISCIFALTAWTAAALYLVKDFEDLPPVEAVL
eukprot:TRINITY_DN15133_c0_g1_i1.p1 TRINITY_DN15133_c0_g1~~TRINITY_DN15133_c0_g1_i1.p1  ORF type:complete len:434 (+),score=54.01 TRINITY_DN15133_c0_g1_i1:52-1302(+)